MLKFIITQYINLYKESEEKCAATGERLQKLPWTTWYGPGTAKLIKEKVEKQFGKPKDKWKIQEKKKLPMDPTGLFTELLNETKD